MTDHSMPPLPEPDGFLTIKIIGRDVEVNAYRDSTMLMYVEAYAQPLLERIKELEADKARIDWLEMIGTATLQRMRRIDPSDPKYWDVEYGPDETSVKGDSLREAIDAALSTKEKP